MPFIGDEELASLQKQIDISIEETKNYEIQLEELELTLEEKKKSNFIINLLFGILAGLGIGFASYLYFNGSASNAGVERIKSIEKSRVLDSIALETGDFIDDEHDGEGTAEEDGVDEFVDTTDAETASKDVKDSLSGQKVYSVQVEALSKNKYPVLSSALAVIATKSDYYKYSIGVFNSLKEAHALRNELVRLGFRDAFVASYVDGERQAIHEPGEKE